MLDSYYELIDALSETPRRLAALAPEPEGAPRAQEHGGLAAIVMHLIAVERVYRGRMQEILARDGAYLRSLEPDPAAAGETEDLRATLDELARERGKTMSLLMNLSLRDWERTGIHDEYGELSIEDLVERLVDHDAEHLAEAAAGH